MYLYRKISCQSFTNYRVPLSLFQSIHGTAAVLYCARPTGHYNLLTKQPPPYSRLARLNDDDGSRCYSPDIYVKRATARPTNTPTK